MLAIIGPESNRFALQIVRGANEAHGFALGPHQDGMGDGGEPLRFHPAQQRAVADPSRAKNNVLALRQVVREKDAFEVFP